MVSQQQQCGRSLSGARSCRQAAQHASFGRRAVNRSDRGAGRLYAIAEPADVAVVTDGPSEAFGESGHTRPRIISYCTQAQGDSGVKNTDVCPVSAPLTGVTLHEDETTSFRVWAPHAHTAWLEASACPRNIWFSQIPRMPISKAPRSIKPGSHRILRPRAMNV